MATITKERLAPVLISIVVFLVGLSPGAAGPVDPADALFVGAPLTDRERDDAWQFCVSTLAHAPIFVGGPDRVCGCFPAHWQAQTSGLHRLALRIALAPASRDARVSVWAISHLQGGLHEDKLQKISTEFQAAVRQSIKSCSH